MDRKKIVFGLVKLAKALAADHFEFTENMVKYTFAEELRDKVSGEDAILNNNEFASYVKKVEKRLKESGVELGEDDKDTLENWCNEALSEISLELENIVDKKAQKYNR